MEAPRVKNQSPPTFEFWMRTKKKKQLGSSRKGQKQGGPGRICMGENRKDMPIKICDFSSLGWTSRQDVSSFGQL